MKSRSYPVSCRENIVIQEIKGGLLIYNLKTNKAFYLNETAALVWQECDGETSIDEISRSIAKRLNAQVGSELIWLALGELKENNLLANEEELVSNFKGLNRREVIRTVGMASLISLPVVLAMIAPTAAHAQSVAACVPAGVQAIATAPNTNGAGLLACLSAASQKCCNVPPFAFQSSGPNICDGFSCSCTYDCQ